MPWPCRGRAMAVPARPAFFIGFNFRGRETPCVAIVRETNYPVSCGFARFKPDALSQARPGPGHSVRPGWGGRAGRPGGVEQKHPRPRRAAGCCQVAGRAGWSGAGRAAAAESSRLIVPKAIEGSTPQSGPGGAGRGAVCCLAATTGRR